MQILRLAKSLNIYCLPSISLPLADRDHHAYLLKVVIHMKDLSMKGKWRNQKVTIDIGENSAPHPNPKISLFVRSYSTMLYVCVQTFSGRRNVATI